MIKDYDAFCKKIGEYANSINLKKAVGTRRRGGAGLRDRVVFGKLSWTEALSYLSIIQSIVIFTALIPDSVGTVNEMLAWMGLSYRFPIEISSVGAIIFIGCVFLFGLIAMRHIGTSRRAQEISGKLNASHFLIVSQNDEIIKNQKEIIKLLGDK